MTNSMGRGDRTQFSADNGHLYDVVAVGLDDNKIIWVEPKKTLPNAEAIIRMAVMRQGVDDRFFSEVPHGAYQKGDEWQGKDCRPELAKEKGKE